MSIHDTMKAFQNAFHDLVNHVQDEITVYLTPALEYVKSNGGKSALILAETVLTGAVAGTPWATLVASLEEAALAQGVTLAQGAADAILNLVKAKLTAEGKATV